MGGIITSSSTSWEGRSMGEEKRKTRRSLKETKGVKVEKRNKLGGERGGEGGGKKREHEN